MPRYSANISIMFLELPFLDRFAAARRAGFKAVECWFPYEWKPAEIKSIMDGEGLEMVGINTAAGNAAAGEWGLAGIPGRSADFQTSIAQALEYAAALNVPAIHVMAGTPSAGTKEAGMTSYLGGLEHALKRAEGSKTTLLVEPLNARDRPGYLVGTSQRAGEVIDKFKSPQLKMMFDMYHVQIAEGDIITRLRKYLPVIGHIQIAGVPDRGEPNGGELNYRDILAEIDKLGWAGWVGCEYKPRTTTLEGLGWLKEFAA